MPVPSLPGFVYDEQKKKFFKIQPNHNNYGTRYTKDAIRRREKAAKAAQESESFRSKQNLSLIQARMTSNPSCLNTKLLIRSLYAKQTISRKRDDVVCGWAHLIDKTSEIPSRPYRNFDAQTFAFDTETQHIIYQGISNFRNTQKSWIFKGSREQGHESTPMVPLSPGSYVSSISVSQWPRGIAFATSQPTDRGNVFFYSFNERKYVTEESCGFSYPNGEKELAYSCAVDPSGCSFAVGCRSGIYLVDLSGLDYCGKKQQSDKVGFLPGKERTDAFGIGYLSPRSLISGWRSGYIKQWDTRASGTLTSLEGEFQRPGSGCLNLKVLNEHMFTTISVGNSAVPLAAMRVYDIRCGRKREKNGKEWTEPVVQCPDWECPTVRPMLPLAADGGMNLIAAPVPHDKVALFNARTGEEVSIKGKTGGIDVSYGEPDSLQLVSWDGVGEKGPRLFASGRGIISEWS